MFFSEHRDRSFPRQFLDPHAVTLLEAPTSPLSHHAEKYGSQSPRYYLPQELKRERQTITRHASTLLKETLLSEGALYPLRGVLIVGSFAHGNAHPDSDVDLLGVAIQACPTAELARYTAQLQAALQRPVHSYGTLLTGSRELLNQSLRAYGDLMVFGYYLITPFPEIQQKIAAATRT